MTFRIRPWQLATLVILLCAGVIATVFYVRTRRGTSPAEVVSYLPGEDAVLAWVDVDALRKSGILDMLSGSKAAEELEYRNFVEQTRFDYRQNLQTVALSARVDAATHQRDLFAVARGSFDWKRIFSYTKAHGGECGGAECRVPGTRPGRYLSFYALRSDLIALAVTSDPYGALLVDARRRKPITVPSQPLWLMVSASALRSKELFPEGTHAFATALEGADRLVFSLEPSGDHFELAMNALCRNVDEASGLLVRMEQTTATLRKWIAREHQTPNPADLSGVLTSGAFRREDSRVLGAWNIRREFVGAVVNGTGH